MHVPLPEKNVMTRFALTNAIFYASFVNTLALILLNVHDIAKEVPSDFIMCDTIESCGQPEMMRPTYGTDILHAVEPKAHMISKSGSQPVLLQIGVDGLSNPAKFTDVDLYQQLGSILPLRDFRLILVDPSEDKNAATWTRLKKTSLKPKNVQILNGLVMGECPDEYVTMYRFSNQVDKDFHLDGQTSYQGWTSTDKESPVKSLTGYVEHLPPRQEVRRLQWETFANAPNVTDYIKAAKYHCFTPSMVLKEAKIDAVNLAMVIIDAEGQDLDIVDGFLKAPVFEPGWLQWEGGMETSQKQIRALRKLGFRVGRNMKHPGSDASNVIALQPGGVPQLAGSTTAATRATEAKI